ncbi:hypothetical protein ACFQU7_36155 [Pseudoroseomonas wenyumeiae]
MKFAVERFDLLAKARQLGFQQPQPIDFKRDLQLQQFKIDRCSMQTPRLGSGCFETIHQSLREWPAVG